LNRQLDLFTTLLMAAPENALFRAAQDAHGLSTVFLSRILGVGSDVLEWWLWENKCGERGHRAGIGDDLKPMRTLEDYVDLLMAEADLISGEEGEQ
jgi:hypothetical protein